jgi:hypothetical protein
MKLSVHYKIRQRFPKIEGLFWETAYLAREFDPDIQLNGLWVTIRPSRSANSTFYEGIAYPVENTRRGDYVVIHPAGKISISLSKQVSEADQISLFAHELRHIAQFHRGRKINGHFNNHYMGDNDIAEEDCYDFQDKIVDRLYLNRSLYNRRFNSFTPI